MRSPTVEDIRQAFQACPPGGEWDTYVRVLLDTIKDLNALARSNKTDRERALERQMASMQKANASTLRTVEMLRARLSLADSFHIAGETGSGGRAVRATKVHQMNGSPLWSIRCAGYVLNRSGEWEWEPRPSSRGEAFLARCRFDTLEQAIKAYEGRKEDL